MPFKFWNAHYRNLKLKKSRLKPYKFDIIFQFFFLDEERVNFNALYELSKMAANTNGGKPRHDEDNISIIELDSVTVSSKHGFLKKKKISQSFRKILL